MTEYVCNVCNKTYIKKHAYDKHMTLCNDTNNDIVMAQPTRKKKAIFLHKFDRNAQTIILYIFIFFNKKKREMS